MVRITCKNLEPLHLPILLSDKDQTDKAYQGTTGLMYLVQRKTMVKAAVIGKEVSLVLQNQLPL